MNRIELERLEQWLDERLDGKPAAFRYRVTHVFRREDGDWNAVLRHADPLATFIGPTFAHFSTQAEDVCR